MKLFVTFLLIFCVFLCSCRRRYLPIESLVLTERAGLALVSSSKGANKKQRQVYVFGLEPSLAPTQVALEPFFEVTANEELFCVRGDSKSATRIHCYLWSNREREWPIQNELSSGLSLSLSEERLCVLVTSSEVRCVGPKGEGPVQVIAVDRAQGFSLDSWGALILRDDGKVMEWHEGMSEAHLINSLHDVAAVSISKNSKATTLQNHVLKQKIDSNEIHPDKPHFWGHACILHKNGKVQCAGDNTSGQCGKPKWSSDFSWAYVPGLSAVTAITLGEEFSCMRLVNETVSCLGNNRHKELAHPTAETSDIPLSVYGLLQATWIFAGPFQMCAGHKEGGARCWGKNDHGQLGDGLRQEHNVPMPIKIL